MGETNSAFFELLEREIIHGSGGTPVGILSGMGEYNPSARDLRIFETNYRHWRRDMKRDRKRRRAEFLRHGKYGLKRPKGGRCA